MSSSVYVSEPPENRIAGRSGVTAACRSNSPCRVGASGETDTVLLF
ncbi:hypothetical protein BSUBE1_3207 [Bacillus subtilis E1]|nr:hypothetical protein EH5_01218 [Bacillus subtilis]CCU59838.1 hypothetical protein BSUBE1_3207 [Bacillus subtilis E1]